MSFIAQIYSHLFVKLSDVDRDLVGLLVPLELEEADLILDDLAE